MNKFPKSKEQKKSSVNSLGLSVISNAKEMNYTFDEINQISLNSYFKLMLIKIEGYPDVEGDSRGIRQAKQSDIDKLFA